MGALAARSADEPDTCGNKATDFDALNGFEPSMCVPQDISGMILNPSGDRKLLHARRTRLHFERRACPSLCHT